VNRRAPLFADIAIAVFILVVFFTLIALGGCAHSKPIATFPSETGCTYTLVAIEQVEVAP
jgi:hypothetical protein